MDVWLLILNRRFWAGKRLNRHALATVKRSRRERPLTCGHMLTSRFHTVTTFCFCFTYDLWMCPALLCFSFIPLHSRVATWYDDGRLHVASYCEWTLWCFYTISACVCCILLSRPKALFLRPDIHCRCQACVTLTTQPSPAQIDILSAFPSRWVEAVIKGLVEAWSRCIPSMTE